MLIEIRVQGQTGTELCCGIQRLDPDEYDQLIDLMAEAAAGKLTYIKLPTVEGACLIGKDLLRNCAIHVKKIEE